MSIDYQGNLSDWFTWRGLSALTMAICIAERLRIRELLRPGDWMPHTLQSRTKARRIPLELSVYTGGLEKSGPVEELQQ